MRSGEMASTVPRVPFLTPSSRSLRRNTTRSPLKVDALGNFTSPEVGKFRAPLTKAEHDVGVGLGPSVRADVPMLGAAFV